MKKQELIKYLKWQDDFSYQLSINDSLEEVADKYFSFLGSSQETTAQAERPGTAEEDIKNIRELFDKEMGLQPTRSKDFRWQGVIWFIKRFAPQSTEQEKENGDAVSLCAEMLKKRIFRDEQIEPVSYALGFKDCFSHQKPETKEISDDQIKEFIDSRLGNTGNFMIDKAVDSGFFVGAKWMRDQKK